ncbi:hypothetical protein ACFQH6_18785 [Halobacteriaceae archaeon GCM10025711]
MSSDDTTDLRFRRRTMLRTAGAALTSGLVLGGATGVGGAQETYRLVQDGNCTPLVPLQGQLPVDYLYNYNDVGTDFSAAGPILPLQASKTSRLFLYTDPDGVTSLVILHGEYQPENGEQAGGAASFAIEGLPEDGEWVVKDDEYSLNAPDPEAAAANTTTATDTADRNATAPPVDAEAAETATAGNITNLDQWDVDGSRSIVHWTWGPNSTDGGVYSPVNDASITIRPWFNRQAVLYGAKYKGTVDEWQALTGDIDDPEIISLDMSAPITIEPGSC